MYVSHTYSLLLGLSMCFHLLNSLLLLFILFNHFFPLLYIHLFKHTVVPLVIVQFLLVQVNYLIANIIKEALVMRYN